MSMKEQLAGGVRRLNTKETLSPECYRRFLDKTQQYKAENYEDVKFRLRRDGNGAYGSLTKGDLADFARQLNLSVGELVQLSVIILRREYENDPERIVALAGQKGKKK